MGTRIELHHMLEQVLGSPNVYFQPPEDFKMAYPCIRYKFSDGNTIFADNAPYRFKRRYQITVIDANPDSEIPDKVAMLPMCIMDRAYQSKDLNHYVFNIYY